MVGRTGARCWNATALQSLMNASPYGKEKRKNLPEGEGEHRRACAQQRTES